MTGSEPQVRPDEADSAAQGPTYSTIVRSLDRVFWLVILALATIAATLIVTQLWSSRRVTETVLVVTQLVLLAVLLAVLRRRATTQAQHLAAHQQALAQQIEELSRAHAATRSATHAHERSRAALEVVLAGAPVGIAVLDAYGRVEEVNAGFAAFAGLDPELAPDYFAGRYLREVAFEVAQTLEPIVSRATGSTQPVQELEMPGAVPSSGGAPRLWRVSVYSARRDDGSVRAIGVVAVDITEYRNMERQLLQAQKMEAVGRLTGSIAHDFNNLLTAISAFAQFAQEELDPRGRARDDIGQILLAAERGAALTRRLMAFSQPQPSQETRALDLSRVLRDLTEMLKRLIGEDITLNTYLAADVWPVDADPSQIEQVVLNLVVNARDAMPSGGTIVLEVANTHRDADYVRANPGAQTGPHVMIAVTDTGTGMDAETRSRIFEPFFTTKPIGKGTGLGLATVRSIMSQLGGDIWVYSEPGRGSTFKVYLRRSAEVAAVPHSLPAHTRLADIRSLTLLLVEDDPAVRRAVQRTLERHGCTVHVADNGRQALDLLDQIHGGVDVVLTDLVMPEMGGLDFSIAVRARAPGIRLILMSGYTVESVQHQQLRQTGAVFLEKPFSGETLLAKVQEAMEGRVGQHG